MTGGDDFWTRRKAAVLAEEQAAQEADTAQEEHDEAARLAAMQDADILTELDLPDPAGLAPGDDIAGFMAPTVPERLRKRALRQLWRLNPDLANLDGLLDYGEDFTDAAVINGKIQTAYQVGRGMLAHLDALAAPEPEPETAPETAPDPTPDIQAEDSTPTPEEAPEMIAELPPESPPEFTPPAPRRMHFAFEG